MTTGLWWMMSKDLLCEISGKRSWPSMMLLGIVVAVVFALQAQLPQEQRNQMCGVLLWVTILFAGLLGIDRSCSSEQDDGCWEALLAYPVSPAAVYWSKLLVNVLSLTLLEILLIPAFGTFAGVRILNPIAAIVPLTFAANFGIAALGTLLSALTNRLGLSGQLLAVLVLPLMIPVILAAAEGTRLIALGRIDEEWWRWFQFLIGFALIFVTVGSILFEFVVEE